MRWPDHPRVDLVTTDGFLFPNAILEARGLMARKGFPESYDVRRLLRFLAELKSGATEVARARVLAPHVRHRPRRGGRPAPARHRDRRGRERAPDARSRRGRAEPPASSCRTSSTSRSTSTPTTDDVERWYVDRLLLLRETSLHDPKSFFHFLTQYSEEATRTLREVDLGERQPREPAREHRPDRGPRPPRARERQRPRHPARPPAQALIGRRD